MSKYDHLIYILSIKIGKTFTFSFHVIYLLVVRIRLKYRFLLNINYILVCNCITASSCFYKHKDSEFKL